jgi:N-6 DNA Methylase
MDRTAVKNFAIEARVMLLQQVKAQAERFGITVDRIIEPQEVSGGLVVAGVTLDVVEKEQYWQLRRRLDDLKNQEKTLKGAVAALIDEVAYTWFNRLAALRFMEVNGYLKRRALSSSDPKLVDPDLLREASGIAEVEGLPGFNKSIWLEWVALAEKVPNRDEFLYRRLLGLQCVELAVGLPFLFGESYSALFMPMNLLNEDSIVRKLVHGIAEEDWLDTPDSENGVEIVGWLYQFYISERKDEVIGAKKKVEARDIPAATQLFTPHWIVRYMVENSLGRLWLEAHPESRLREKMPYFLESAPVVEGDVVPEGQGELLLTAGDVVVLPQRPEELTVIDPACGSGHILVYAFDLLFEIYKEQGYLERDIPGLILEHNLHGLDIDERAVQLASFAVLMKARAKNARFLRQPVRLKVLTVKSTRGFDVAALELSGVVKLADWQPLLGAFEDADNLGSLITPPVFDADKLQSQIKALKTTVFLKSALVLSEILDQSKLLQQQYLVVVANPPYMGGKGMNSTIKKWADQEYPNSKSDLFAMFIERIDTLTTTISEIGLLTPFVWLFLSSYEKFRADILKNFTITSLTQLEYNAFEPACIPVCTFTLKKPGNKKALGTYIKLSEFKGHQNQEPKLLEAIENPDCGYLYYAKADDFAKIPGSPIAYWISNLVSDIFQSYSPISSIVKTRRGLQTGDGLKFVREWFECSFLNTSLKITSRKEAINSNYKWFPLNSGGYYRKWFGNIENVVNWNQNGKEIKATEQSIIPSESLYFLDAITWSMVSSSTISFRYQPNGVIPGNAGPCLYSDVEYSYLLSFLNSSVVDLLLRVLSPTLNFDVGKIANIPFKDKIEFQIQETVTGITKKACLISQSDWDNFETSWNFQTHPLLRHNTSSLTQAFIHWQQQSETAFRELQNLEEENNHYWIEAYGLQDELTPEVPDDQITIRRADLSRDIRSLISYAVGCMMGRYSLDQPGLIHAGQPFEPSRHNTFPADADAILPITDQAYFDDDIVSRFIEFIKIAYSPATLTENLDFIANALELKTGETAQDRIRRYFVSEFISDHIKTYKKRPIYWLFTSGKKRAFSALVYLHRYTPDTIGRLRTDYVLELQLKLEKGIEQAQQQQTTASSTAAKKQAAKQLKTLQEQQTELRDYQAKLQTIADQRIELDLDDGVAYNYTRFEGIVYEGGDLKMADLKAKAKWKLELLENPPHSPASSSGQSLTTSATKDEVQQDPGDDLIQEESDDL